MQKNQLFDQGVPIHICDECDNPFCEECLTDWMVQQINSKYIKDFENITLKCPQNRCENVYTLDDLQEILDEIRFEQLNKSVTQKLVQSDHQFISCPNSDCSNYGFIDDRCCIENISCQQCDTQWRLPTQMSLLGKFKQNLLGLSNANIYSDLYKVMFAQMCHSCKVMIVRSEGCKFMECAKCKYQFCWLCLSEFYTQYHYYESMCPLRIVPIYASVILGLIFFDTKLMYNYSYIMDLHYLIFVYGVVLQLTSCLFTFMIAKIIRNTFLIIQSRRKLKHYQKLQVSTLKSTQTGRDMQKIRMIKKQAQGKLGQTIILISFAILFLSTLLSYFETDFTNTIYYSISAQLGIYGFYKIISKQVKTD